MEERAKDTPRLQIRKECATCLHCNKNNGACRQNYRNEMSQQSGKCIKWMFCGQPVIIGPCGNW